MSFYLLFAALFLGIFALTEAGNKDLAFAAAGLCVILAILIPIAKAILRRMEF